MDIIIHLCNELRAQRFSNEEFRRRLIEAIAQMSEESLVSIVTMAILAQDDIRDDSDLEWPKIKSCASH
jgi:uncharacterized protein YutE (UPF0331/DUF86 family)